MPQGMLHEVRQLSTLIDLAAYHRALAILKIAHPIRVYSDKLSGLKLKPMDREFRISEILFHPIWVT